jgi:hypothetical protein
VDILEKLPVMFIALVGVIVGDAVSVNVTVTVSVTVTVGEKVAVFSGLDVAVTVEVFTAVLVAVLLPAGPAGFAFFPQEIKNATQINIITGKMNFFMKTSHVLLKDYTVCRIKGQTKTSRLWTRSRLFFLIIPR